MNSALAGWLKRLENSHPRGIALGLERVRKVGDRLGVLDPGKPVVTVGGTNGKGTTVAFLDAALRAGGYRTGVYTSPHLNDFCERITVGGAPITPAALVEAFEAVDAARGDETLTYFEFATLAAFWHFRNEPCDAWILEVGLGGRLDAVNAVDPDVAVVTRVARDHVDLLGHDLDGIGREKAGIFRPGRPAVIGQLEPPSGLLEAAGRIGASVHRVGVDFSLEAHDAHWTWKGFGRECTIPIEHSSRFAAANAGEHAAAALAAIAVWEPRVQVDDAARAAAFQARPPPGRLESFRYGGAEWLFDVAHNADAACWLRRALEGGRYRAIFAAAKRKDIRGIVEAVGPLITYWHLPDLGDEEIASSGETAAIVRAAGGSVAIEGVSPEEALAAVAGQSHAGDPVLVFGSFRTVQAVRSGLLERLSPDEAATAQTSG